MLLDPPRIVPSPLRWGSANSDTDETRALLQSRVQILSLLSAIFSVAYLAGAVFCFVARPDLFVPLHLHPSKVINLLLAVAPLGPWFWLRARPRPAWLILACDLDSSLLVSLGIGAAVAFAPGGYHFELVGLLALQLILVLRAAIAPSTSA